MAEYYKDGQGLLGSWREFNHDKKDNPSVPKYKDFWEF